MSHIPGEMFMRSVTDLEFRAAMGRFASGVTVVTTHEGGHDRGATVSAFSSVSNSPPSVLVCLKATSDTGCAVHAVRSFVVNVLSRSQDALALRFARKGGGKFNGLDTARSREGHPVLSDSHISLECRVVEEVRSGTHIIFIAEVEGISFGVGTSPLTYHSGRFGRFLPFSVSGNGMAVTDFDSSHDRDLW